MCVGKKNPGGKFVKADYYYAGMPLVIPQCGAAVRQCQPACERNEMCVV